jgi:hypothetical protein
LPAFALALIPFCFSGTAAVFFTGRGLPLSFFAASLVLAGFSVFFAAGFVAGFDLAGLAGEDFDFLS